MIQRADVRHALRASSVRTEMEALRRVAEERRWSEFIRAIPADTQMFGYAADAVSAHWNEFSEDDQDFVIRFKDVCEQLIESPPEPNLVERVKRRITGTSDDERRQMRRLSAAIGGFLAIINQRLREEERVRKLLNNTATSDPEVTAHIRHGKAEAAVGLGQSYTHEEFRTRFISD